MRSALAGAIRVDPAALSVGETLAENAVEVAAELEFAVETRRAQGFIRHSRGMDGDERVALRTPP